MERTFEIAGPIRLHVENEVGLVTIVASNVDTTTVSVTADSADSEELVDRTTVESHGSHVVVKVPRSRGRRFLRRNGVRVGIAMPERSDVSVLTSSADVDVTGLVGVVDVKSGSGSITMDDVASELRAKTASGDVTVESVGGGVQMSTASGSLRCSSVAGRALFSAVSGDVEIGSAGDRVDVRATSGNVRLGELARGATVVNVSGNVRVLALVEGTLNVRSVSGDVAVGVADGVELRVDLETMSGQVSSDIPLDAAPSETAAERKADIRVRNVSGSIEIERALQQVA